MLPPEMKPIVDALVRERKARKLTQGELAAAAGISRRALNYIEGGGDCALGTISKLYAVLGLELAPKRAQRMTLEDVVAESEDELFGDRPAPGG